MPIDEPTAQLIRSFAGAAGTAPGFDSPQACREAIASVTSALAAVRGPAQPAPPPLATEDVEIAGIHCRVYRPSPRTGAVPTVVTFHGGGFVAGSVDTHDDIARLIAAGTGGVVVSVGYRLAPEAPYPAAADDCEAVTRAVLGRVDQFGGDARRVGVAGDSAGGNLAAVVTQRLRDEPCAGGTIAAQLLLYPATDMNYARQGLHHSREQNATGYLLTTDDMRWFAQHYLPSADSADDPGASPLRGNLEHLPPAVISTAEFDPLRDEGKAYAEALKRAGTHVMYETYAGLTHSFAALTGISPSARAATSQSVERFSRLMAEAGD